MSWISVGAALSAVAVVAGAFGAHGLKARLDADALALWETAARYLMYGGLATTLLGLFSRVAQRSVTLPGWSLVAGSLIFSGTVALLALGGPRWLGAVTPLGGLLMIVGLAAFAIAALGS